MKSNISIFIIVLLSSGCFEINSNDPTQVYRYWAGSYPPHNLEIIESQYWQSPHWTKEYNMYLKIKPSKSWWDQFVYQNHIVLDKGVWIAPSDAPSWFNPPKNATKFKTGKNFDQGSRYFRNEETGVCFIYEIQL
jgi:hypothetical protein